MVLPRYQKIKGWLGEIYLIASVLFYWVISGTILNPVGIGLLLILLILIIGENPVFAWVISMLFLLLNLYLVLAMVDELNEFTEFNRRAMELLAGGCIYLGLNIVVSLWMLVKWGRKLH